MEVIIIKSTKDDIQFSTRYLMLDLDYDTSDIVERLKELTLAEYSETLIDKDDSNQYNYSINNFWLISFNT